MSHRRQGVTALSLPECPSWVRRPAKVSSSPWPCHGSIAMPKSSSCPLFQPLFQPVPDVFGAHGHAATRRSPEQRFVAAFPAGCLLPVPGAALIWGKPQTCRTRGCHAEHGRKSHRANPLRQVLALIPDPSDRIMTFYDFFLTPLLTNYCQILPIKAGSSFTRRHSPSTVTFPRAAWLKEP